MFVAFFALFYWQAPLLYRFHRKLKYEHPILFKLIGSNAKYISEEGKWIQHYRITISLMLLLMLTLLLVVWVIK